MNPEIIRKGFVTNVSSFRYIPDICTAQIGNASHIEMQET